MFRRLPLGLHKFLRRVKRQRGKKLLVQHGKQARERRNERLREVDAVRQKVVLRDALDDVNERRVKRVVRVPHKRDVKFKPHPLCDVVEWAPPVLVVRRPQLQVGGLPLGRRRPPNAVRQFLRVRGNAQQRALLKRENEHYVLLRAVRQPGKLELPRRKVPMNQQPALKQRVDAPKRQVDVGRQRLGKKVNRRARMRTTPLLKNVRKPKNRAFQPRNKKLL